MHYALSLQAIGELSWQTWCCKPGADFLLIDSDPGNLEMNKYGVYNSNNIVFQEDVIHC